MQFRFNSSAQMGPLKAMLQPGVDVLAGVSPHCLPAQLPLSFCLNAAGSIGHVSIYYWGVAVVALLKFALCAFGKIAGNCAVFTWRWTQFGKS